MVPTHLQALFWDIDVTSFNPRAYPQYTIFRVLEHGDEAAVAWLRETFSESEIRTVLCTERRLSRRSANFWALIYKVPCGEIAALNLGR